MGPALTAGVNASISSCAFTIPTSSGRGQFYIAGIVPQVATTPQAPLATTTAVQRGSRPSTTSAHIHTK